ncbi:MAG: hypothetical protein GX928_02305 [Ruminococcaceae bacterium]|nr:hypothetical protein [Oscillospiraceae bacterium]
MNRLNEATFRMYEIKKKKKALYAEEKQAEEEFIAAYEEVLSKTREGKTMEDLERRE